MGILRGLCIALMITSAAAASACGGDAGSSSSDGAGGTGTGSSTGAAPFTDACQELCKKRNELGCGQVVDCSAAECPTVGTTFAPWCDGALNKLIDCMAAEPASSFECDMKSGDLDLKDGFCTGENEGYVGCLYEGPPEGLPDLSGACVEMCGKMSKLACAAADCVEQCNADLEPAAMCNGAFGIAVSCISKQAEADFGCTDDMPPEAELRGQACAAEAFLIVACQLASQP